MATSKSTPQRQMEQRTGDVKVDTAGVMTTRHLSFSRGGRGALLPQPQLSQPPPASHSTSLHHRSCILLIMERPDVKAFFPTKRTAA